MIRIATDAGGTFTDLVGFDDATGRIVLGKALTTPKDPSQGVLATLRQAMDDDVAPSNIGFFVHGGTTVINAITERKGVATALVTTRGFRDVLAIGRGNRPDLYNLKAAPPVPFVPRHLRFEVTERIDATGATRTPLNMAELLDVAARIAASGVAAVAVAFLHGYANPAHEARAASLLRARLPGLSVVASHEVSRQWREYERTNTAVLSAYVQPIITRYLHNLSAALEQAGLACPLHCMQSNGGLASFAAATRAPLTLVESGPAGGVAGAVRVGQALGETDLLYLDVGGTTAKCSLIRDGKPVLKPDYKLEWSRLDPGYPVQVPVVDIVEIGAGGGSIAWTDPHGAIRVGPHSAGADPGPACYGLGGTLPTVTDAKLLTGVLDPARFAGGSIRLDMALAAAAMQPLAAHLGCSVTNAARAVIRLAEAGMMNALKLVTVQRGHDPRDLTLVASGGGGPMHAAELGRELGARRVVIPRFAGLFSAWGMLAARPRLDLRRTHFLPVSAGMPAQVGAIFRDLSGEADAHFISAATGAAIVTRAVDMRYAGQEHSVAVPIDPDRLTPNGLMAAFHAAHRRAYTFALPDTPAELVTFHLAVERDAPRVELPLLPQTGTVAGAQRGVRNVLFADLPGPVTTAVYERDALPPGADLPGPLLIEEATATTLVLPGQTLRTDPHGLLIIEERHEP